VPRRRGAGNIHLFPGAATLGALARGDEVALVADGHSTYDGKGHSALQKTAEVNAEFGGRAELSAAGEVRFDGDR